MRTIKEVRKALRRVADGNHGDGDLRAVTSYLADVAKDAEQYPGGDEAVDQVRASAEEMRDSLDRFIGWLDGARNPLFDPARDKTTG